MTKQLNLSQLFDQPDSAQLSLTTSSQDQIKNSSFTKKNTSGFDLSIDAIYIFIQLICSCLAGVYNEYLLKTNGARVDIYVQNVFMYIDSIVCNLIFLLAQGDATKAFNMVNLKAVFAFNVIIIVANNAAIGIVTSFFLRYLNSILKTFASALELLFTAILCYLLFDIPIYLNTMCSIAIVSIAIYLYSLSPVVNTGNLPRNPHKDPSKEHESVELLKGYETA